MTWRPSQQSIRAPPAARSVVPLTASASALAAPPPLVAADLLAGRRHTHAAVARSICLAEERRHAGRRTLAMTRCMFSGTPTNVRVSRAGTARYTPNLNTYGRVRQPPRRLRGGQTGQRDTPPGRLDPYRTPVPPAPVAAVSRCACPSDAPSNASGNTKETASCSAAPPPCLCAVFVGAISASLRALSSSGAGGAVALLPDGANKSHDARPGTPRLGTA